MPNVKRLRTAEETREQLTEKRLKKIRHLYAEQYVKLSRKVEAEKDYMTKTKLKAIRKDVVRGFEAINEQIESGIMSDMRTVCVAAVEDKRLILSEYGFREEDVLRAFYYVPEQVVTSIVNGSVYNEGWSLATAIWGHEKVVEEQLEYIIGSGVASGDSTYEIAQKLQKYVNPNVAKKNRKIEFQKYKRDSKGNLIKDKNGKYVTDGKKKVFYFGNVDYNAARLARTMISHAYQQTFEAVNELDPFVQDYIWHASGQHGRTCSICLDRDGRHFKKDELPLDHPNGMCTFEAYTPQSGIEIAGILKKWLYTPYGTYPEIDRYAATFLD